MIRFHTLAVKSQWNNETLPYKFYLRLSEEIKDRLATVDLPSNFAALVELAIKIDSRLQEREQLHRATEHDTPAYNDFSIPSFTGCAPALQSASDTLSPSR